MSPTGRNVAPASVKSFIGHARQKRARRTKADIASIREAIIDIIADDVLTAMQRGAALQKHFTRQGLVFSLTNGKPVSAEVAALVAADVRVVAVNDGLFPCTPQTWRWIHD